MFMVSVYIYSESYIHILEYSENASPYFCTFLANRTINAIEKLLAGINVPPRIGMNQSLI